MQCPKCGFVMGDLETECLRCRRAGAGGVSAPPEPAAAPPVPLRAAAAQPDEKECPRCGKATFAAAETCDKCGYEYQPEGSRAERYQARLAEEARTALPPSALRRTVPPALSWSIIGACLLAMGVAGWAMFGGALTGPGEGENLAELPIAAFAHRHKPHGETLRTVTYKVTGSAATAMIAYQGADGAAVSLPDAAPLPWTQSFKAKAGTTLSVSARPTDPGAATAVEIDVDGIAQKQGTLADADGQIAVTDTL